VFAPRCCCGGSIGCRAGHAGRVRQRRGLVGAVTTRVIVGAVAPATSAGLVQLTDTFPSWCRSSRPVADTSDPGRERVRHGPVPRVGRPVVHHDQRVDTLSRHHGRRPDGGSPSPPRASRSCSATSCCCPHRSAVSPRRGDVRQGRPLAGSVTVTVIAGADVPCQQGSVQLTETLPVFVKSSRSRPPTRRSRRRGACR